ncbi:MAG: glycerate kinase, partial [Deltaproteobacteria bacterium]
MTGNSSKSTASHWTENSILIAMNGFKGSLSNLEACESVSKALKELNFSHSLVPIGDGGAGTGLSLHLALGGDFVPLKSVDPKGKEVSAAVLCFPDAQNPKRLYIDSSSVCGFTLIKDEEKKALQASSRGLGILLRKSIARWESSLREIWIGLGDSAISDMGVGMLSELGVVFVDSNRSRISPSTENLQHISDFSKPTLNLGPISLTILCDVSNPVCGPQGSAITFSPQKGASPSEVALIAKGMDHFASRIENKLHRSIKYIPMTGSAGGLASAFLSFFDAHLVPGCEFLLRQISFDEKLSRHTLVITGEGKTDAQTLKRKAPAVIAEHAKNLNKKCIFISGSLGEGTTQLSSELNLLGLYACGK